jgi:general secretion pathway protein G
MKRRPLNLKRALSSGGVFFPWERKKGFFGILGRARVRVLVGIVVVFVVVVWIRGREEKAAGVRSTRATITTTHRAVMAFRADNKGTCPKELAELVEKGYSRDIPVDAWGHPLRLTCPGRRDPQGFEVSSDGPDGVPGGLDRVE